MATATYIKTLGLENGWKGDARLYHLSEPLRPVDGLHERQYDQDGYDYVAVSAVVYGAEGADLVREAYIFGADNEGYALSMSELPGSYQGGTDHAKALRGAGYDVVIPEGAA